MFPHQRLFLAVTISLASIVLADVLVQPGYKPQSSTPSYSQLAPHRTYSAAQGTEQLSNKKSYLPAVQSVRSVQTVYPYYESHDSNARSNLLRYPLQHHYPYHYHYARPKHLHFAKIGGHGYTRPSVFVGYPRPVLVPYHRRYRRSDGSNPTSNESSKSAIVAHDDDVAAKSPLTDVKHTAIDSLLPEHEPTDTNDKRVENRQTNNDHVTPRHTGLFDLPIYYPGNIQYAPSDDEKQNRPENTMEHAIIKFSPSTYNRQQTCTGYDNPLMSNRPSTRVQQSLEDDYTDDDDSHNRYQDASPKQFDGLNNDFLNTIGYWQGHTYDNVIHKDFEQTAVPFQIPASAPSLLPWTIYYYNLKNEKTIPTAQQNTEKKSSQLQETGNTAQPRQNYYDEPYYYDIKLLPQSFPDEPMTTTIQLNRPIMVPSLNPYVPNDEDVINDIKDEDLNVDDFVRMPYSNGMDTSLPNRFSYHPQPDYDSNKFSESPTQIPNYTFGTNTDGDIISRNIMQQIPETQSSATNNYPLGKRIQAGPPNYNYYTYPSNTLSSGMFSSPVYY